MRFKERYLAFAALQIAPVAGSPERTLERFREQVRRVRDTHPRVSLVIAPELHLMAEGSPFDPAVARLTWPSRSPARSRRQRPKWPRRTGCG